MGECGEAADKTTTCFGPEDGGRSVAGSGYFMEALNHLEIANIPAWESSFR